MEVSVDNEASPSGSSRWEGLGMRVCLFGQGSLLRKGLPGWEPPVQAVSVITLGPPLPLLPTSPIHLSEYTGTVPKALVF